MKKTIIVYGSSTGTCETIAQTIGEKLGVSDIINVSDVTKEDLEGAENLLLGTSTWGAGDMQDEWYDGVNKLADANLSGKTVALFGCGDCESFGDTFCGGMSGIYNAIKDKGINLVGKVATSDYHFDDSESVVDGEFIGLALDDMNESDKTEERINAWVENIKASL